MRRAVVSIIAGVSLFVHAPAHAQGIVYEIFGIYLDALRAQAGIPGMAAAIVDDTDVVWERAYGYQNLPIALAARPDTPFNADGLTQVVTAAMALRCAEERRLSLDDRIGSFRLETAEPDASIRQLLTHTSRSPSGLAFALRPERLQPLWPIIRTCTADSYRESFANLLSQLAMFDSVPGPNILRVTAPDEGVPSPDEVERYAGVLQRRATPYAVDARGRAFASVYPESAAALTPATGLVSTVRDLAKFDLALKQGILVHPDTLAHAWSTPVGADGLPLPHGIGWFVQHYKDERVVWQFGAGENASSSMMITLPSRRLTLILMANSDGLAALFGLQEGDVTRSPFARLFLSLFVR